MKKFMIYLIGISGSGKTTIAKALEKELTPPGQQLPLQLIDGDEIRAEFGNIFGYSKEERMKCNQAVRVVLRYLLKNNISVILAQVAPYEEMREAVKSICGSTYIEVYLKCSVEECTRRDVKGYYKKHKTSGMDNLNGVSDIYEVPVNPDIIIDTEKQSVDDAIKIICDYMERNGYGL